MPYRRGVFIARIQNAFVCCFGRRGLALEIGSRETHEIRPNEIGTVSRCACAFPTALGHRLENAPAKSVIHSHPTMNRRATEQRPVNRARNSAVASLKEGFSLCRSAARSFSSGRKLQHDELRGLLTLSPLVFFLTFHSAFIIPHSSFRIHHFPFSLSNSNCSSTASA